jgi:uncharacterized protein YbcC (UPF0753/DUF2309 family)
MSKIIKKTLLKQSLNLFYLTLGISSFFYLLNNSYKNFDDQLRKTIDQELNEVIKNTYIENKIDYYMQESMFKNIKNNKNLFIESFRPGVDSLIDDYVISNENEIKDNITKIRKKYAKKWIDEGYSR